jgi:hypothetical protein
MVSSPHLGLTTRFSLLLDCCGFVDVGRSLWRENGSAVYSCRWSSPAQLFLGPSSPGLMTTFYCLRFDTPPTWRARSPYLYPPGTGWPSYNPRHWVPFRRLLHLAGLRWRYSNPPLRGLTLRNGSWSSLHTLGTDGTENRASNSYPIVVLHIHYLAMAVCLALSIYATVVSPIYILSLRRRGFVHGSSSFPPNLLFGGGGTR